MEQEIVGVSPRLPLQIRFNPKELLARLHSLGNSQGAVPRQVLVNYFRSDPESLPLEISGQLQSEQIDDFAEALTDRVRLRFGSFTAAPTLDAGSYLALTAPDTIGNGSFDWDLSKPLRVFRPLMLKLNPFAAAQEIVHHQGLEAVVRQTIVPNIAPRLPTCGNCGEFAATATGNYRPGGDDSS